MLLTIDAYVASLIGGQHYLTPLQLILFELRDWILVTGMN